MSQTEDGYSVDPKELWKYHKYLNELDTFTRNISTTACLEGLNPDGFTGLLTPLQAVCNLVADDIVRPALEKLGREFEDMAESINRAAEKYGLTDEMVAQGWDEQYNDIEGED